MPFKSVKQELYLRKNEPKLWKEWVRKYGHAPGYQAAVTRAAKKSAVTRKKSGRK
jgi:SRSO17 transposase